MAETSAAAPAATEETAAPERWGWMDTAGIIAAILAVIIAADVFTDGRLISRRLRPRPAPEQDNAGE